MKKYVYTLLIIGLFHSSYAQKKQSNQYVNPAIFNFNDGNYQFSVEGFFQPVWTLEKTGDLELKQRFNARRSFFMLGGKAVKEKVSFLVQTNFSDSRPLMDAWIAWHPDDRLTITMGQKQHFANNAEMRYREDRLQFSDRSILSSQFCRTGREFGLFAEGRYGKKIGIAPSLAVTSGDGRNSFGEDSRDTDIGGLKYAARLDLFPLGYFSEGNDLYSADLMHEKKLKIATGIAWSMNRGASEAVGEGHGIFSLYNENGDQALADYRKINADFLAKYKGFSFLSEWVNSSATGLKNQFTDQNAVVRLAPEQISSFLALGNGFNTQLGYVSTGGYSADLRFGKLWPEFETDNSIVQQMQYAGIGLSKYIKGNQLKLQSACTVMMPESGESQLLIDFLVQMGF